MAAANRLTLSPELELECIITLDQASELSSESKDTIKRNHPDKIIRLSKRRLGMRVRDALRLGKRPIA
jgi:hypothetical protein